MRILCVLAVTIVVGVLGGTSYHYWPRSLDLHAPGISQSIKVSAVGTQIFFPNHALIGELAQFDDGLFAFLMFDYLRGRPLLRSRPVMLTSQEEEGRPVYRILVKLPDDLILGVNILAELKDDRLTSDVRFDWVLPSELSSYRDQTTLFMEAYNGPASQHLKTFHAAELQQYLRRFIRFKSFTDPRISRQLEPVPSPLTRKDASHLAANIIDVARFYDVPIDLFLGIGAMENNYMNVAGDLKNTAWKHHVQPGDIVLRRKRGRVLVRNDSMGVWQITRESLRYAQKLYLKDNRDYTKLPSRLRPPRKLEIDSVDSDVLTTYAGLLLRDLLYQFHGNVTLAAGAYNGGAGNPNLHYAGGVQMVANYARRVIGRAAEIDRVAMESSSVSSHKLKEVAAMEKKQEAASDIKK